MLLYFFLVLCVGVFGTDYILMTKATLDTPTLNHLNQESSVSRIIQQAGYTLISVEDSYAAAAAILDGVGAMYIVEEDAEFEPGADWGWDRIDQVNLPLDGQYDPLGSGLGVYIYIVDSGILTTHTEFADPASQIGQRAALAFEASASSGPICGSHGTSVASHAAGRTVGVARRSWIRSVKVSTNSGVGASSCNILLSSLLEALMWLLANAESNSVINLSLSGPGSLCIDTLVADLRADGAVVVSAAGNDGANNGACVISPARASASFTVAATTQADSRWSGSNYGSCIDIFAPGAGLRAAIATSNSAYSNSVTGTSFAAPHVAGAAAIFIQTREDDSLSTTPTAIEQALRTNSILGVVSNSGGTVNRLVHVGDDGGAIGSASILFRTLFLLALI